MNSNTKVELIENLNIAANFKFERFEPTMKNIFGQRRLVALRLLQRTNDIQYESLIDMFNYLNELIRKALGINKIK